MASTYLTRTQSAGNRKTWTYSVWLKRSKLGGSQNWGVTQRDAANNNIMPWAFDNSNQLNWYDYNGAVNVELTTNRLFRDTNAWSHIVLAVDTTQATSTDRVKMYVNGVQETSFAVSIYPSLNYDFNINQTGKEIALGGYYISSVVNFYEGLMAHAHFIDGTAYDASAFGETDTTTGIWKPKTAPSVTYGTNGFFLKFENSGSLGTDSSGNGNNFTVGGGTPTQTVDTPSNVFSTWNFLVPTGGGFTSNGSTFENGNTKFITNNSASNYGTTYSTLGMSKGKYYMEVLYTSSSNQALIGIVGGVSTSTANVIGGNTQSYGLYIDGRYNYNNSLTSYGTSWTSGDYIGVFLDLDNNKLYFSKNGTIMNSGVGISINSASSTELGVYRFAVSEWNSSGNGTFSANFGNGYFGTTAVSSANSDVNGLGIFEYNPSSGTFDGSSKNFLALCTKNINSQEYS